jgi:predicted acylesterase/phospholipase RssA
LPTGVFSSAPLQAHLQRMFAAPGRSDDFRQLKRRLVLVATDLDSGKAAPFGLPGWDHVPISKAVAASAALPGLFPPVQIEWTLLRRWGAEEDLARPCAAGHGPGPGAVPEPAGAF